MSTFKVFVRKYSNRVGILGMPFGKGQKKSGVARGPECLRNAGLIEKIKTFGEFTLVYFK